MKNCILIGVAGGSGSGKTTVASNLVKAFKAEDAVLVEQLIIESLQIWA